jgi:DNA-binding CsgD family transcriptional regulator
LQLVLAETLEHGATEVPMEPAAALARLQLSEGRVEEALQATEQAIDIVARKGTWLWATELAPARVETLVAAGRIDEAAELVTAFGRGLRGRNAAAPRAGLLWCQAILTEVRLEHTRAAASFARVAAAWEALPRPYDALLARARQGLCLVAAGRADDAAAMLPDVVHSLSKLGARSDADRVLRVLRENGVVVRRRGGGRPNYRDRLSPRELDVVHVLADGLTNRQIADRLVLSPQTVAVHVRSAMRKLRVSSRTALAVRAVELGLIEPAEKTTSSGQ